MNPPQKWYSNQPPIQVVCPLTKKRKSRLETQFEKEYPFVTWTLRDLSLTFKIPVSTLKPLMQDKEACLKLLLKL